MKSMKGIFVGIGVALAAAVVYVLYKNSTGSSVPGTQVTASSPSIDLSLF